MIGRPGAWSFLPVFLDRKNEDASHIFQVWQYRHRVGQNARANDYDFFQT